jgi:hypothetical protein
MKFLVNGSDKNTSIWVEDENKKRICTVKNGENDNEIAALIAAAPELLEACQYALDNLAAASRDNLITAPKWFHVQLSETKLMLDSAIQKANGGK